MPFKACDLSLATLKYSPPYLCWVNTKAVCLALTNHLFAFKNKGGESLSSSNTITVQQISYTQLERTYLLIQKKNKTKHSCSELCWSYPDLLQVGNIKTSVSPNTDSETKQIWTW